MNTQAHFPPWVEPSPRHDPVKTARRLREQARKAREAAVSVIDAVRAARSEAKQAVAIPARGQAYNESAADERLAAIGARPCR